MIVALSVTAASGAVRRVDANTDHQTFVAAAAAMRDKAVQAGDQAYGAVVVRNSRVVGYGLSRVVAKNDPSAHAEREAIRDAQRELGPEELVGCVMYSTSRPCANCERAAADARIGRMFYGSGPTDAGPPRRM